MLTAAHCFQFLDSVEVRERERDEERGSRENYVNI